jgi:hypothetical protein
MALFIKLICAPEAATGLCRTCTWGTVRKGFRRAEAEVFCRLVGPNSRVRYAVRECSSYIDRHAHLRPPPRRAATASSPRSSWRMAPKYQSAPTSDRQSLSVME